jgi:hypothetical protein
VWPTLVNTAQDRAVFISESFIISQQKRELKNAFFLSLECLVSINRPNWLGGF